MCEESFDPLLVTSVYDTVEFKNQIYCYVTEKKAERDLRILTRLQCKDNDTDTYIHAAKSAKDAYGTHENICFVVSHSFWFRYIWRVQGRVLHC